MSLLMKNEYVLRKYEEEEKNKSFNLEEGTQAIREWLTREKAVAGVQMSDEKIRKFLYGRKYSVERVKETIMEQYRLKRTISSIFKDRSPENSLVDDVFKSVYLITLPELTKEGYRIFLLGGFNREFETGNIELFYKMIFNMFDIMLEHDYNTGVIFVYDINSFTMQQLVNFTPLFAKNIIQCLLSYPIQLKAFYILNNPSWYYYMVNMVSALLPTKIKERFFVSTEEEGFSPLYHLIDKKLFPNEWGGTLRTLKELVVGTQDLLLANKDILLEDEKRAKQLASNTSKQGETEEVFGMAGSFRKFNLD